MKISELTGGNFITLENLGPKPEEVVIRNIKMEDDPFNEGQKRYVASFEDGRMLSLNRTRLVQGASILGDDTDSWVGKSILIGKGKSLPSRYGQKDCIVFLPEGAGKAGGSSDSGDFPF